MVIDFTKPGSVNISHAGMTQDITKDRPLDAIIPYTGTQLRPAAQYLFDVSDVSDPINPTGQKLIHSIGAKILFLGTPAIPDIILSNSFHTKRVLAPTTEDLRKLQRTLSYLEDSPELTLTLACSLPPKVHTFIDASLAVHPDKSSHTGVCATLGTGMFYCKSTAQKCNATS